MRAGGSLARFIAVAMILVIIRVRKMPATQPFDTISAKRTIRRIQQPVRHRHALGLVAVEKRLVRAVADDERQFPRQVVGILQPGVHALSTGGAVHVRRVAEQEAPPLAKVLGAAVLNTVGRKPVALVKRERPAGLLAQPRPQIVEGDPLHGRAVPPAGSR